MPVEVPTITIYDRITVSQLLSMIHSYRHNGDDVQSVKVEQVNDTLQLTITIRTETYVGSYVRDAIQHLLALWTAVRTSAGRTSTSVKTDDAYVLHSEGK